ncbi:MAG: hypothetical protein JWM50_2514 [Microbacteriaceae bacterium]|jgi:hypothetical protein|nr:hypothetical protein [Microbacteriaceae bacterium]
MTKPAPKRRRKPTRTPVDTAVVVLYAAYAVVFVFVVFYTLLHLVFFGFNGDPVGVDLGLGLVLPLLWIVGLLRAIALRATPRRAQFWGFLVLAVVVVLLAFDTARFAPIFWG